MPIEHVSDTARWVAFYRAMESERPDALFRDPHARRLAGPRGEEIVRTLKNGRGTAWAMIVRTAVMDRVILEAVERRGVDLVVNLAAGLDARPWRLPLPRPLRWVDVDFPEILAYKLETLGGAQPHCDYEAIPADLTKGTARRALFQRLGDTARHVLVVSEGLLVYLAPDQVESLAADLSGVPSVAEWLIDLANPRLLALMQKQWGKEAAAGNAPFRFAPAEGTRFFARFGWREAEFHSLVEDAHRLRREMRLGWLWRNVIRLAPAARQEDYRRMSGVVLLARDDSLATGEPAPDPFA